MTGADEPLAAWSVAVMDIPATGLARTKSATAQECQVIADALAILACESVSFDYVIMPTSDGSYRLKGDLTARVVQQCVVTLEPIVETINDRVLTDFRPADDLPDKEGGVVDMEEDYDEEPIIDQSLAIGRIAYEHLASALNPYPRKDGATLDWKPTAETSSAKDNPFAVLAKLKDKR
jgi:uncharacterized metal-binding protein YceD (DUF177 family)